MSEAEGVQRHSQALDAELISDAEERARAEARNGLRQFDRTIEIVEAFLQQPERPFRLRLSMILDLHRIALEGISSYAGNFRPAGVRIGGSKHQPPPSYLVPALIEDMCDYVNERFTESSAVHLAAYVMWRLNWVHPFADGNGRTSRATSYMVLCLRLRERLPGSHTIPEQIVRNRGPYFAALDAADAAAQTGLVDVSKMEALLSDMLAAQLLSVVERAIGTGSSTAPSFH